MMSKQILALSALLAGTWAQSTTSAPSTASAASATGTATGVTTYTIAVGASGHKFTPAEVEAKVGDVIEWKFYPSGHWIIRGDYNYPCIPYEYIGTERTGFSSGAKDVQAITDDGPRFRVTVNDTDPIFFYCGAPGSCVDYHMMGVVNPSENQTLEGWLEKAEDVDYQLTPGEPWPTEDGFKTPTAGGPKKTGSSSDDDDDDDSGSHHNKLSAGAIAGIAIGGAAIVIIGAGLIYLCGRRGGFDKAYRKSFRNSTAPPAYPAGPPVAETYPATPAVAPIDPAWATKQAPTNSIAAYGSPPISPQPTGYTFPQGVGTMMSADGSTLNTLYDPHMQHIVTPPPPMTPQPHPEPIAPVELPGSVDPGNSPLPTYSEGQNKKFSWAGEESGYRPSK